MPVDTMKRAVNIQATPSPEVVAISIQPISTTDGTPGTGPVPIVPVPGAPEIIIGNNINPVSVKGIHAATLTVSGLLRNCESSPDFVKLSPNSPHVCGGMKMDPNLSDAYLLNSSNSVNSLVPRDELAMQHGFTTPSSTGEGSPSHGFCIGVPLADPARNNHIDEESALTIILQIIFPFLVAGLGMVGAGLLLDTVQHWDVFENISEIIILVPSLLGLKGNLEMTLAARLSTQAHLGTFDKKSDQLTLIVGNMALIELQAVVVGFLASWFAIFISLITNNDFNVDKAFLVCASSILTAASASILLGLTMVGVVMVSRRLNINPDNIATPIAASLGDVTSLALLSGISTLLYGILDKMVWVGPIIFGGFCFLIPILVILCKRNRYTEDALRNGWLPVIAAMVISSIAGFILDEATGMFNSIALFQPVVNGVGGNLVAIHASRISTFLHQSSDPGKLPPSHPRVCVNPCATFFGKDTHIKTGRILMLFVVPGHLIFIYILCYTKTGGASLAPSFVAVYLLVSVIQVAVLLYTSLIWTHLMWRRKLDPDNCSIPYLTALGDLLGISLLTLGFLFLSSVGVDDIGVGY